MDAWLEKYEAVSTATKAWLFSPSVAELKIIKSQKIYLISCHREETLGKGLLFLLRSLKSWCAHFWACKVSENTTEPQN